MTSPPGVRSWASTVAGWPGGPHQRSSWRGSDQSSQTRTVIERLYEIGVAAPEKFVWPEHNELPVGRAGG